MIATDRPREHLCAACVNARGYEARDDVQRVAVDVQIRGACDDCGAVTTDLEAWRSRAAPEPAPTLRVLTEEGESST